MPTRVEVLVTTGVRLQADDERDVLTGLDVAGVPARPPRHGEDIPDRPAVREVGGAQSREGSASLFGQSGANPRMTQSLDSRGLKSRLCQNVASRSGLFGDRR